MIEEFVLRALLGGAGVALVAGPLGCFVIWRRMAYFGDSLAHSALLGIALGVGLGMNLNQVWTGYLDFTERLVGDTGSEPADTEKAV